MKVEIESIFVSVARHLNFSEAARELGLSVAAVSKQIQQLEKQLGVQLLIRNTRSMRLSTAGQIVLESHSQILAQKKALIEDLEENEGEAKGNIRITTTPTFARNDLPKLITSFREKYPLVNFTILASQKNIDIVTRPYDLAIRFGGLKSSELVAKKLVENPFVICCAPAYAEKFMPINTLQDLASANYIIASGYNLAHELQSAIPFNEIHPDSIAVTADDPSVVVECIVNGLGVSILPYYSVRNELASGKVIQLLPDLELPCFPLSLVYAKSIKLPFRVRQFIDHLTVSLRN